MNVTLRNRDIDNGLILVTEFTKRGLPVPLSFAIAKTIRKLRGVVEVMQEERKKLIDQHALTDVEGKKIEDEEGNVKLMSPTAFAEDFDTLMKQETEVDVHQVNYEKLTKMKDRDGRLIQPSPRELEGLLLLQMIKEEEKEDGDTDD